MIARSGWCHLYNSWSVNHKGLRYVLWHLHINTVLQVQDSIQIKLIVNWELRTGNTEANTSDKSTIPLVLLLFPPDTYIDCWCTFPFSTLWIILICRYWLQRWQCIRASDEFTEWGFENWGGIWLKQRCCQWQLRWHREQWHCQGDRPQRLGQRLGRQLFEV